MNVTTNVVLALALAAISSGGARAWDSAQHSSRAAQHSAASVAHTSIGSAKLVAAALAIPLTAAGALGHEFQALASSPAGTALPVDEAVFTIGPPPDQAIAD